LLGSALNEQDGGAVRFLYSLGYVVIPPNPPPSAFPLRNQNEASPATLQFIARHRRKILFSLREKEIRRAQNEKSKEYFSAVWRCLLDEVRNYFEQNPLDFAD